MNVTIGGKVHHPAIHKRPGIFSLCGLLNDGQHLVKAPYTTNKTMDCKACLYMLKAMDGELLADSGITYRIIASVFIGNEKKMDYPTFYLSSITTPEVQNTETAVTVARTILNVPAQPIPSVSYRVKAIKVG